MADTLVFEVGEGWDGPVVRLAGEIDLATIGPLRDLLLAVDDAVLTVDFCDVTFMDTTGANLLVTLQRRVRERGGKLVVYGMRPNQVGVLAALGLVDYFDSIVPD
jgi:anti-anti-sigma factor